MIHCIINGSTVYPSTADKIKVTLNNPYIEDSGSYTYDVTFPMSVHENQKLFANIHRIDVHKRHAAFDDCKLYADNILFMSGKGIITSVTESEVKLQIVGGKSRIKYDSKLETRFIDEISYPTDAADIISPLDTRETFHEARSLRLDTYKGTTLYPDYTHVYALSSSWGIYVPVYDEAEDIVVNRHAYHFGPRTTTNGAVIYDVGYITIDALAIQPQLMAVLRQVLQSEGYMPIVMIEEANLSNLYIANTRKTTDVAKALPHWSVYTFLDEVAKLLNIVYEFNSETKECTIYPAQWQSRKAAVAPEMLYEYSCEVNEEADASVPSSMANLQYDMDGSAEREWRDVLPADVRKEFGVLPYEQIDHYKPGAVLGTMTPTDRQRRQAIFRSRSTYFVWASMPDGFGEKKKTHEEFTPCGFFSPLWRDTSSDQLTSVRIIPAAMRRVWTDTVGPTGGGFVLMPSITGGTAEPDGSFSDDDGYYSSVQELMEAGGADTDTASQEDDTTHISLFFFDPTAAYDLRYQHRDNTTYPAGTTPAIPSYWATRHPVCFTDCRAWPEWSGSDTRATLDLARLQCATSKARFSSADPLDEPLPSDSYDSPKLNAQTTFTIRFLTDDIPDPSKIYIFRNRRFVCQKIEMEVTGEGVSRLKTGYFYEIL